MLFAKLVHRFDDCFGLMANCFFGLFAFQSRRALFLKTVDLFPFHHPVIQFGSIAQFLDGRSQFVVKALSGGGAIASIGPFSAGDFGKWFRGFFFFVCLCLCPGEPSRDQAQHDCNHHRTPSGCIAAHAHDRQHNRANETHPGDSDQDWQDWKFAAALT